MLLHINKHLHYGSIKALTRGKPHKIKRKAYDLTARDLKDSTETVPSTAKVDTEACNLLN